MKRLFLACTPRTGNTWIRKLLAASLGIKDVAAHSPSEIDWESLPECIAAMHWHRTPEIEKFLQGYEIVVTVRHPLDVLISILQFAPHEPATARWLEGEGGNEDILIGASPTDARFIEYALSDRAAALFSVSFEWSETAQSVIRYEEMVAEPRQTLIRVLETLGESVPANLDEVIEAHQIGKMRSFSRYHFWRGQPGLWRVLILEEHRQAIYHRHREVFRALGYTIDGAPAPSLDEARRRWIELLELPPESQTVTAAG